MQRVATGTQGLDETWLTFYRVDCDCGQALEVKAACAGTIIKCNACRRELEIVSLSGFKKLPAIMRRPPIVSRIIQFGLKPLLFLFVPFSFLAFALDQWPRPVLVLACGLGVFCAYLVFVVLLAAVLHNFRRFMARFWDALD